ncbi:MAG: phage terminase large subunit [Phycisphaeraceae bacterium]|nr:phage terminase large subunit [Phycisphaeraceae bacterium]
MTIRLDYRPILVQELTRRRRLLAEESPQAFAQTYLRHHFVLPPSRMHEEIFALLAQATKERAMKLAIAAPRGHAKTTVVSFAYVLWSMLTGREPFVLLISATSEQAGQLLMNVRRELTDNERLLQDYPEICLPLRQGRGPVIAKAHHLVLPNDTCLRVLGSGQGLRGMKHRQNRPSLIICDDLEDLEQAQSEELRQKLLHWLTSTLLKAGQPQTNIIVAGTVLHHDSLLAQMTHTRPRRDQLGGWRSRVYQAVESFSIRPELWQQWEQIRIGEQEHEGQSGPAASEAFFQANQAAMLEGTRVLWPELEDYAKLMAMRVDEGYTVFQTEKQNQPLDPSCCVFRRELFRYWDDPTPDRGAQPYYADVAELISALDYHARFYGACDPSLGKRNLQGDYGAIITLVKHKETNVLYVIDADIAKRSPDELIERIIQQRRIYDFDRFAIETNHFQELLADQLKRRAEAAGFYLHLEKITARANKRARIEGLEPLIAQGMIRFSRRHTLLLDQLFQFPLAKHDDGPDALEMAVNAAIRPIPTIQEISLMA